VQEPSPLGDKESKELIAQWTGLLHCAYFTESKVNAIHYLNLKSPQQAVVLKLFFVNNQEIRGKNLKLICFSKRSDEEYRLIGLVTSKYLT
jgi:hypothetical protein